jgi:hypothetical protein
MARGMMRVARKCRLGVAAIERGSRLERCIGDVAREMSGQPGIEGDGEDTEPDA